METPPAHRPAPEHLFVGTIDGVPICSPEPGLHHIWPKFLVMVLLQGSQHFVIDDAVFRIDAGTAGAVQPLVLMLNIARPATLRFVNDAEVPLRKVMLSAPLAWIDRLKRSVPHGVGALNDFFGRHLAQLRFAPARQILTLAEQLMAPPPTMTGEIRTLYRNSRALDIMCLACAHLAEDASGPHRPCLVKRRQSERVRDFVLGNLARSLTIEEIAREAGASVSCVQRQFKERFGETVFAFIRRHRLALACDALERRGLSIAQAAHLAGYADPSAFTTAFKRVYGVTPSCRRR